MKNKHPILIVDDEAQSLQGMALALKTSGITNIFLCQDSRDAKALLSSQDPELVLLDLQMPHVTGEELMDIIVRDFPNIPVIIVTANSGLETAVACMKKGAFDYVVKPVTKERLVSTVRHAIRMRDLQRENDQLRDHMLSKELQHPEAFAKFDSQNEAMKSVFMYTESIAESPEPVLITGETGVGKELIAKAIHVASGAVGAFVPINVAGLDDNAFSDTLFGHKKGAFTGANTERNGLIELASGGSLFLDEIGDLSMDLQVKLLRLLQEREYLPLGSDTVKKCNTRFIVATNKDIDELRESLEFRNDLFYRICHHHVHIPPLRERLDDLPLLVDRLLGYTAEKLGKKKPTPPAELITLLSTHTFPGNIRELETMIADAVSNHKSKVLSLDSFKKRIARKSSEKTNKADIYTLGNNPSTTIAAPLPTLKEAQDTLIKESLRRASGNQSIAAQMLGITRQALNRRLLRKKEA